MTNELLQKERELIKDLLLENNTLKIAIKEEDFENRELSTRINVSSQDPLQNFINFTLCPTGAPHVNEKRQPTPTAPTALPTDMEISECNENLSNSQWPFF